MSKKIPKGGAIYVAHEMVGQYEGDEPIVIDKRNGDILDPNDIDTKINIYEREVRGWFLEPALDLLAQDSSKNSFVVLMICMSYIEGVEQYKTGIDSNRRSREFFTNSIKRLYPNKFSDAEISTLYSKSRCALFHNGMVRGGVVVNDGYSKAIEFLDDGETIHINHRLLLQRIIDDFDDYIDELRSIDGQNADEESENAETIFDRMFSVL